MRKRVRIRHLLAGLIALTGLVFTAGAPAGAAGPQVLLDNLSSPRGLAIDQNGNPVVAQGALGPPGPIVRYFASGPKAGTTQNLSGVQGNVDLAWGAKPESFWTLGSGYPRALYREMPKVTPSVTGRLSRFAIENPDPYDQDNFPEESNPFGITTDRNGDGLVADAAANSVVRVGLDGKLTLVARLAPELVKTDHLPPGMGLPPQITAEAVPTSIAVSANGTIYVGELKGFPFRPGSSRIWKIPAGTKNAVCSANPSIPGRGCTTYKGGLTSIADIAVAPNGSAVYAFEFAEDGVGAFEEGCFGPGGCPPAVLLKIQGGTATELARGAFSAPGGVAVSGSNLYVTDDIVNGGRLLRLGA